MSETVIVDDTGFLPDNWTGGFDGTTGLDLAPDADIAGVEQQLPKLGMIRIDFPNFADGRGFTLARILRLKGYKGRLRARGHVLADQYAMARRAGFDEVEISAEHAARQTAEQWAFRAGWRAHDYQSRLRANS